MSEDSARVAAPPPAVAGRTSPEASLVRALGTWVLAAGIVNVTIGGGIFRLPAAGAAALGPAAPLAYVICAIAMALVVLCFAEAGSRVSLTGGLYAYVEVAFGPLLGFLTGVFIWVSATAALAAVSNFLVDTLAAFAPVLGGGVARALLLTVIIGALATLNVLGVRGAARFNTAITVAKLLPLVLLVVLGAFAVRAEHLAWPGTPSADSLARASAFLIFAFLGVESALVPSGEVRDPARTVPRALFIAMATVTVVYIAVHVVAQGILGPALPGQTSPLAEAARVGIGGWGRTLMLVGAAVSMFGYVSGMTLGVPRMLYAFARDGFLPPPLASVHPRWHTPWIAILVQAVVTIGLALTGGFERLALVANGAALLAYAACCAASWELRRRDVRAGGVPFRVPAAGVVPVLALLVIAWLLRGLTAPEWKALAIVLLVALPVYGAAWLRGAARRPPAAPTA